MAFQIKRQSLLDGGGFQRAAGRMPADQILFSLVSPIYLTKSTKAFIETPENIYRNAFGKNPGKISSGGRMPAARLGIAETG